MNRKISFTLIMLISCKALFAGSISDYILEYRNTGQSDFKQEIEIVENYNLNKLISELTPFYTDSIVKVRQKAYYLTYKKGVNQETRNKKNAVDQLLKACNDINGGIVGQNLTFLQEFAPSDFTKEARSYINNLLDKERMPHYNKLILLAGYIGTGSETMKALLLQQEVSAELKWNLSLALARQGDLERLNYCLEMAKKIPVSNDMVSILVPDLIYTRQKPALDYCVEMLQRNKKDCYSANPDKPAKILCGYRIMELLAPVIVDYPFRLDATGSIDTENYESALVEIQKWFLNNPEYQISN